MIRVTGHFELRTTDRAAIDSAFDDIADALMLDASVMEPTLSADLGKGYLLIELVVDTDDALEAAQAAAGAVRRAFSSLVEAHGATRVVVHRDLLRSDHVELETELVAASA